MKKDSENNTPLKAAEISILQDSRYFLNRAVDALNLQMNRLEKYNFHGVCDHWNYVADVHFYIVALKRLRQSVLVGKKVGRISSQVEKALKEFDDKTSDAMNMRHILEHVDDYIKNKGRNNNIKNSELYTILFADGGIVWGGLEFNRRQIHNAAGELVCLYRKITSDEFHLYKDANERLPKTDRSFS